MSHAPFTGELGKTDFRNEPGFDPLDVARFTGGNDDLRRAGRNRTHRLG